MNKKIIFVFIFLIIVLFFVRENLKQNGFVSLDQSNYLSYVIINDVKVNVEVADSNFEHAKGLMDRSSLNSSNGMLFVFPEEDERYFWMKNTLISLDMIFIDRNFEIVDLNENAIPCDEGLCEVYESKPSKYVLEVNSGFIEKNNVSIGDFVEIEIIN